MNVALNWSHTGTPGQARKPFTETTNDVKSKKRCRAWKLFFFCKGFTQMKVLREFPTVTHIIVVTQECNFESLSELEPSTWTQLTVLAGGLSARPPRPRCQSGTVSRSTYAAAVIVSFQQSCTPSPTHQCNTAGPIWSPSSWFHCFIHFCLCVGGAAAHRSCRDDLVESTENKKPFYFVCIPVQTFIFMFFLTTMNNELFFVSCFPLVASRLHSSDTERLDFCNKTTIQGENFL